MGLPVILNIHRIHVIASLVATATIFAFFTATIVSELFGSHAAIGTIKQTILWGMLLLVPAIAMAGATGFRMGGKSKNPHAVAKRRRMPFIAANGLLILLPSAFFLAGRAGAGQFDGWFMAVQAIELVAGGTNLTLMGLNIRDGMMMKGRIGSRGRRPRGGNGVSIAA
jgi:hypothetical protein